MRTRSAERLRKARAPADAGEISGAIGFARAKGGVNAEEPQDAQIVLGDPLVRIADEAHASCGDILKPADVVVHDAGGVDRQAVDGEIAPLARRGSSRGRTRPWPCGRRSRYPRAAW